MGREAATSKHYKIGVEGKVKVLVKNGHAERQEKGYTLNVAQCIFYDPSIVLRAASLYTFPCRGVWDLIAYFPVCWPTNGGLNLMSAICARYYII